MAREVNFGKMLHGGDYNPEQWLHSPEILEIDIEYFIKAKIIEVSLGIFSWAVLEPVEGEFHFEWMEKIIDRLYENGISTILATTRFHTNDTVFYDIDDTEAENTPFFSWKQKEKYYVEPDSSRFSILPENPDLFVPQPFSVFGGSKGQKSSSKVSAFSKVPTLT